VVGKPRLAATIDVPDAPPHPRAPIAWAHGLGVALRATTVLAVFTAAVAAASWAILIATVVATPFLGSTPYLVHRAPWTEGHAPVGETVWVSSEPVDRTIVGRFALQLEGDTHAAIMQIVAKPNSIISTDKAGTIITSPATPGSSYTSPTPITRHNLGDAYLALCVTGPCGTPGTPSEVPIERVLGKVLGSPKFIGMDPAPAIDGTQGVNGE
jgi:hypothetical protein